MAAKSTVAVKFTGDVADLKRATGEAEQELGSFGSRVGPKLTAGMAGLGAAAGGALITGMQTKMERDKVQGKLSASIGLTPEESARLGKVSGEVYADGWGESFEEVSEGAAEVMSVLGEFSDPDQLEPLTKKALDLAYIFETDVASIINTTGFMLRNGLAKDADEAFDIITAGLQRIPSEMSGELLDTMNEYSQSFAALGFEGQEAMELLVTAGQDTSVGLDKVGDAVKEFLIRATDGSTATVAALERIGLDAQDIANDLLAGGDTAETAFQKIIDGLLAIEDPAAQSQTAIALFGTPIEDLSGDKIPTFLEALGGMTEGFGDVEGASDEAAQQLDGDARKYQESMRKLETAQQWFVTRFIMGLENISSFSEDMAVRTAAAYLAMEVALGKLADAFNAPIRKAQDLLGLLNDIPVVGDALGGAAAGVIDALPGGGKTDASRELERRLAAEAGGTGPARPSYFGSRPGRAHGGPVHPWEDYIVGENGPEVLRMGPGSGTVVPNHRIRSGSSGSDLMPLLWAVEGLRRDLRNMGVSMDGHQVGSVTRREGDLHALRNAG